LAVNSSSRQGRKKNQAKKKKWALRLILGFFLALVGLILLSNLWIITNTHGRIYAKVEELPKTEVGLVLGTSQRVKGKPNSFFTFRMKAAASAYHTGKVKRLLLSGHRNSRHYDEPRAMKAALLKLGVREADLMEDGEGYRTIDSIKRAGTVFHLKRFTIISQRDHDYRALYIADVMGLDAVAFAADAPRFGSSLRVGSREVLARVKAIMDLHLPAALLPKD